MNTDTNKKKNSDKYIKSKEKNFLYKKWQKNHIFTIATETIRVKKLEKQDGFVICTVSFLLIQCIITLMSHKSDY